MKEPKGLTAHHQVEQQMCFGSPRRRSERERGRELIQRHNGGKPPKSGGGGEWTGTFKKLKELQLV